MGTRPLLSLAECGARGYLHKPPKHLCTSACDGALIALLGYGHPAVCCEDGDTPQLPSAARNGAPCCSERVCASPSGGLFHILEFSFLCFCFPFRLLPEVE